VNKEVTGYQSAGVDASRSPMHASTAPTHAICGEVHTCTGEGEKEGTRLREHSYASDSTATQHARQLAQGGHNGTDGIEKVEEVNQGAGAESESFYSTKSNMQYQSGDQDQILESLESFEPHPRLSSESEAMLVSSCSPQRSRTANASDAPCAADSFNNSLPYSPIQDAPFSTPNWIGWEKESRTGPDSHTFESVHTQTISLESPSLKAVQESDARHAVAPCDALRPTTQATLPQPAAAKEKESHTVFHTPRTLPDVSQHIDISTASDTAPLSSPTHASSPLTHQEETHVLHTMFLTPMANVSENLFSFFSTVASPLTLNVTHDATQNAMLELASEQSDGLCEGNSAALESWHGQVVHATSLLQFRHQQQRSDSKDGQADMHPRRQLQAGQRTGQQGPAALLVLEAAKVAQDSVAAMTTQQQTRFEALEAERDTLLRDVDGMSHALRAVIYKHSHNPYPCTHARSHANAHTCITTYARAHLPTHTHLYTN